MAEKNEELTFSGELILEKERKRKILIYVCIGLGLLALILTILLVIKGNNRGSYQGGEGTIYPYGWQEKRNGTVRLVIDRTAAPGYEWVAEGYDENAENHMIQVETPQQRGKSSCEFIFHPQTEGREALTLVLTDADGFSRLGELNLVVEVTQSGNKLLTSIVSHDLSVYFEPVRGGENTAYPYALTMDQDGYLVLVVWDQNLVYPEFVSDEDLMKQLEEEAKKAESEILTEEQIQELENAPVDESYSSDAYFDWKGRSDQEEVLEYLGLQYGEKQVKAYFRPAAVGGSQIHLCSAVGACEITAAVNVTGNDGTLTIESHALQSYTAPEEEPSVAVQEEEGEEEAAQDTPAGNGGQESAEGSSDD
ncbi:MAG: hypothetical protein J5589_01155 [Firmicutes bacterium]|nr:hypothetical protein [Bacillota bacterium]